MADVARVAMPAPGVDLHGHFEAQVTSGALDAALDRSVAEFDELAQLAGIKVSAVESSAAGIAVHYTVTWTSFHACDDRTFGGSHARVLRGRAEGDAWVFNRQEPLPIRHDSAEEF